MNFLEQDLEEIIFTTDCDELCDRGLYDTGQLFRQVKIGNYGIADLISFHRPYYNSSGERENGTIRIYELKRNLIDINAFLQAVRYARGIQRRIEKKKHYPYNIEIVLIGKKMDKKSPFCFLPELITADSFYLTYYTYNYEADGIKFHNETNYCMSNEGF